jgi:hypothetical protein
MLVCIAKCFRRVNASPTKQPPASTDPNRPSEQALLSRTFPSIDPIESGGEADAVSRARIDGWQAGRGLGLQRRFRPKDGSGAPLGPGRNANRDVHGEKRSAPRAAAYKPDPISEADSSACLIDPGLRHHAVSSARWRPKASAISPPSYAPERQASDTKALAANSGRLPGPLLLLSAGSGLCSGAGFGTPSVPA